MLCQVYIGDLQSPKFHWDGGNPSGNFPVSLCKAFPWLRGSYRPAFDVIEMIEKGRLPGKQTDWGCWVARVNKAQIEAFIDELYQDENDVITLPETSGNMTSLAQLREFVATLEDQKLYALFALES